MSEMEQAAHSGAGNVRWRIILDKKELSTNEGWNMMTIHHAYLRTTLL